MLKIFFEKMLQKNLTFSKLLQEPKKLLKKWAKYGIIKE